MGTHLKHNHNIYFIDKWHIPLFLALQCRLLIDFETSLDPHEARQHVGPDLEPSCIHTDGIPERLFLKC